MHVLHAIKAAVQIQHAVPDILAGPGDMSQLASLALATGQQPIVDVAMVGVGRVEVSDQ